MRRVRFRSIVLLALAALAAPAAAQARDRAQFEAIRAADLRLATIGYRLATGNAALCDRLEPGTGLVLHTLDQYDAPSRGAARAAFGFATAAAIEAVVPGSPAARAGLSADQSLLAIGPVRIPPPLQATPASTDRLAALHAALAALPPTAPLRIDLAVGGSPSVTIRPVAACMTRFELDLGGAATALADGTLVKIGVGYLEDHPGEELAALVAHELAHNILRHRDRLKARGVSFGMLSGLGANVRYFRQAEIEADILSVHLLANAGYDPSLAARFWRSFGARDTFAALRSRSHPHWRDRVATVEAEAARIAGPPSRPALLDTRARPLDGNWQALLVRAR